MHINTVLFHSSAVDKVYSTLNDKSIGTMFIPSVIQIQMYTNILQNNL